MFTFSSEPARENLMQKNKRAVFESLIDPSRLNIMDPTPFDTFTDCKYGKCQTFSF